jgi:hypothetical protein
MEHSKLLMFQVINTLRYHQRTFRAGIDPLFFAHLHLSPYTTAQPSGILSLSSGSVAVIIPDPPRYR